MRLDDGHFEIKKKKVPRLKTGVQVIRIKIKPYLTNDDVDQCCHCALVILDCN